MPEKILFILIAVIILLVTLKVLAAGISMIVRSCKKIKRAWAGESAKNAPELITSLIDSAVKNNASDIHIEPEKEGLRVRYRIDGLLQEIDIDSKHLNDNVISCIKVLSDMDIAETRKAQDGKINMKLQNREVDIRVSTFPTTYGENVVMRLIDKTAGRRGLKDLGFSKEDLINFNKLIHSPSGIILLTGPSGSGKTSTIYAVLTSINTTEKNIITIEDPIEYELPLIRQTSINPKAGVTFANGLRNILRQDPDVIVVGEIRDKETVDMAIQAALTGNLVFSTLHTGDAPSALMRLINMGVEPFLVSSTAIGILAQRLVRLICEKCREQYTPEQDILDTFGLPEQGPYFRGKGCPACKNTGFLGRIGIFELLIVDEDIRKMVEAKSSADEIKKKAVSLGMKTLLQDGIIKVRQGLTTLDEVLRIVEPE